MEKLRIWPMLASAFVALLLTLAFTSQHSIARGIGFGLAALGTVMAISGIGEYSHKTLNDKTRH